MTGLPGLPPIPIGAINQVGVPGGVAAKVRGLPASAEAAPGLRPGGSEKPGQSGSFEQTIRSLLDAANQPQHDASQAINDLVTGKSDNIHSVVVSVAQAELSFRFLLELRNRLTESYQEIMRMQM